MGVRVAAIRTDVARADEVQHAAERVEEELGPIDVWVNNAIGHGVLTGRRMVTAEEFAARRRRDLPRRVHGQWQRSRACRSGTGA